LKDCHKVWLLPKPKTLSSVTIGLALLTMTVQGAQPSAGDGKTERVASPSQNVDAGKMVALLNTAYADTVPYVLEYSAFSGAPLNNIDKVPAEERLEELKHPSLPSVYYRRFRWKHRCDGGDSLFAEREVLSLGNTGFGLRPRSLWTSEYLADFDSGLDDEVLLWDFAYRDRDEVIRLVEHERVLREQFRAYDSFVHLARWVGRWLVMASDVTCETISPDRVRLVSAQMRLTVECSPETGELQRVEFRDSAVRKTVWWWEGTIEGVRFPARHPHLAFNQSISQERDGVIFHGSVLRFESIRPAQGKDAIKENLFAWSTHRPFAAIMLSHQVVDKDGHVDAARTKFRNQMSPPTDKNLGIITTSPKPPGGK